MCDNTQSDETRTNPTAKQVPKSEVTPHPICQDAPDPEKCELFAERLTEASNNIDRRREV